MELGNQLNKKVEDQNLQNKNPQVNKPLSQIQKFQIVQNVLEDKFRHISNNIGGGGYSETSVQPWHNFSRSFEAIY